MDDDRATRPDPARAPSRHPEHAHPSWVRAGIVLLCGFLLWVLLDSTVLQHNANTSVLGSRRSAALRVLGPFAWLATESHLDWPVSVANVALNRTADGGFYIPPVPTSTTTTTRPGQHVTTTTLPPLHPSRRHPLRVLLVGDSIGEDMDAPLLEDLDASGVALVWTDATPSTGLTRLDYYNWIAELEKDVYDDNPQVIIGLMGANDSQSFLDPITFFGTKAWDARYKRHVGQFFTIGTENGRRMFWVSVPIIADTGESKMWNTVRDIQRYEARKHHVHYIDSDLTLDPGGTFHFYLKVGGNLALARTSDGIHLEPAGADLLAAAVMTDMERDLHLRLR